MGTLWALVLISSFQGALQPMRYSHKTEDSGHGIFLGPASGPGSRITFDGEHSIFWHDYIKMSHHKDADMLILSECPHVGHRMSSGLC